MNTFIQTSLQISPSKRLLAENLVVCHSMIQVGKPQLQPQITCPCCMHATHDIGITVAGPSWLSLLLYNVHATCKMTLQGNIY